MSECSGPTTIFDPTHFSKINDDYLRSAGPPLEGVDIMIYMPDKEGNGEICYKGRNRFMGYYKMENETRKTIDEQGYLHSGDIGKLDDNGNLIITGRIKELIVTAGGENIPPVLIENMVKDEMFCISNCMLFGDMKKFLSILITLK